MYQKPIHSIALRTIVLILFIVFCNPVFSQTFSNTTGGTITDNGSAPNCFPITVTGIGNISSSFGIASVKINITHSCDQELIISIKSPNGTSIPLSNANGGSSANYTNTIFSLSATNSICTQAAPFTGTFLPICSFGALNNGQNANGTWYICVQDNSSSCNTTGGRLVNCSITFSNTPAPVPPVKPSCGISPIAGNSCSNATPVCSFNGYCGNTSSAYAPPHVWTNLTSAFCGTINNNSFVSFVAAATTASFYVWVYNSSISKGIQMMFFSGTCNGTVTSKGCYYIIPPSNAPAVIQGTGLTIGTTYYLMFDGASGDVCDYTIFPISGVNVLGITGFAGNSSSASSICNGDSVRLHASGGNGSYSWTGPSGFTATGQDIVVHPTASCYYVVSSSNPIANCPIKDSFFINVNNATPPPTVTPLSICKNSPAVQLTSYVTHNTANTLIWYTNSTGGIGSTTEPSYTTDSVRNITFYVSDSSSSCGKSTRVPFNITINPTPQISISNTTGNDTLTCSRTSISLTASGADTYSWNQSLGTNPTVNISSMQARTYIVTGTNLNGCTNSDSIKIKVDTVKPILNILNNNGNDTLTCSRTSISLTASGANIYSWNQSLGTSPNVNITTLQTKTYILTGTNLNGCTNIDSIRIEVDTTKPILAIINNTGNDTITCSRTSINVTATGASSYIWDHALGTSATVNIASMQATTYKVLGTGNNGCSDTQLIKIQVDTIKPIVSIINNTGNDTLTCNRTSISVTSTGASSYLWNYSLGNNASVTINNLLTRTYTVVGTNPNGCNDTNSINIMVDTIKPIVSINNNTQHDTLTCNVTSISLTAAGAITYLWSHALGNNASVTINTLQAEKYTVIGTNDIGCIDSAFINIFVDTTKPIIRIANNTGNDTITCSRNSISLTASGATNYIWNQSLGNTPSVIIQSIQSQTYSVKGINQNGCIDSNAIKIFVDTATPSICTINNVYNICGPSSVNITASVNSIHETTDWYNQPVGGNILPNGTSVFNFTTPVVNTSTTFYAETRNKNTDCISSRVPAIVTILPKPNLGVDRFKSLCYGDSINLTTQIDTTSTNAPIWSFNNTIIPTPYNVKTGGTYQLIVSKNSCTDTALIILKILPKVKAFAGNDTIAINGEEHQLKASGGVYYLWNPTFPLKYARDSIKSNPIVILNQDQLFIVSVSNSIGCKEKDSVFIRVFPGPEYNTPNAFSPNGDGLNDVFKVVPAGIAYTEWFKIYNRNGQLLFQTNDWMKGWDGTYNGKIQPIGTYIWIVKGVDNKGVSVERKGTVILFN